ncbi:SDR family NAD(P)-dependent oxidoreductase [Pseudonocardia adelaidensis]|uniref:Enoyl-ACP reductase-like protein n=1 Tax=Pseudonocardia adelaidensis TaxID=648754 RepID=A0ABP9NUR7_9PSEU
MGRRDQHTDLRGRFLSLDEIPHLLRRGGGTVVVTSSSNAITTSEGRAAYTAAKRGLVGTVDSAAFDYAAHNIRVNTLAGRPDGARKKSWRKCRGDVEPWRARSWPW